VESGPLRAVIECTRALGQASRITQRYALTAGARRVDIQTHVDWHEERQLLRTLFPVDVRSRQATYGIQFGHIERATHRNTPWDRAKFEVCAHGWMDLSEPGFGVALLDDCKYGHSCLDNVMGLSLLRATTYPDPQADRGEHEFTYSLMVHDGDWRAACVVHEAETLNAGLMAQALSANQSGTLRDSWSPVQISTAGAADVVVAAIKWAEDDGRLIVRLVEVNGGRGEVTLSWRIPATRVEAADLLERPTADVEMRHEGQETTLNMRPFQIVTLAIG
ncbi:MAG: alpha-mannosidase, partial [Phycisphaerae bacterium]|nr:alpha-mannosidase [Phycisphaerae bacterium]